MPDGDGVTIYVHGRQLRQVRARRRRRALLVVLVVLLGAALTLAGPRVLAASRSADAAGVPGTPTPNPPAAPDSSDALDSSGAPATGLDPELVRRVDAAAADAAAEGVSLTITSGWRSAADQQALVEQMVVRYGSEQEAHRWVLPPETSAHVQGLAVDVGGTEGALWLSEHGAAYGLCRTYENEVWHFEPVIDPGGDCPPMHPDSSWGW
jgi:LAS superfamily LD-carboxypeptidase LdcB